ncbi:eukaryotic translation initiation factor 3 subunit B-like [Watersipora subatra]|uniref:eukaryotic translation initiation factor 3 subunit B-like n=1 Tax=Watersipora subatra TaxID=2589382 RepID=UPI00355C89BD
MAVGDGGRKGHKKSESDYIESKEDHSDLEENFSDPEDFIDDITDEELLPDILKQKPSPSDSFESVIVCDNIPKTGSEKLEKLTKLLKKLFSKFGNIVTEHIPLDSSGQTKGYMFLEYGSLSEAKEAARALNGHRLDKHHVFDVNLFSEFDKYTTVEANWTAPEPTPYKDPGNLQSWLLNKECLDQMSIIYNGGETTSVMLNSAPELTTVEERKHWTETYVRWSPLGSYLCTFHSKGIALWGGEHFKQIQRFSHTGVQLVDFSPCERYIVTFSPMPVSRSDTGVAESVIVWDIQTGNKKRGFPVDGPTTGWPFLKWSSDGNYFARLQMDAISVYELPSCGLLDKKSLKVTNVRDFEWSPDQSIISYWVPEGEACPARVSLIEIPSRKELRIRNLFSVADCKLHWQKSGDHLCVKVDRYAKKKLENNEIKYSGMYYNFEIFHVKKKQVPIDTVECKEVVSAFAWEPVGSKFAYIHGEAPRISVSFYKIGDEKITLLKTLEKRQCNSLFWCPAGQFIILAGLRNLNGVLEFVDSSDMTVMTSPQEHFMCTDVEWDPTGRYVSTAVSFWGHKMDNGFWLWNFQGRQISKNPMDGFCQLLWRPRPPSLLSAKQIKEIRKNMKEYSRTFEVQDLRSKSKASKDVLDKRKKMKDDFNVYRQRVAKVIEQQKSQRMELRNDIDTDELDSHTDNFEEEVIEFLVKVDETVIGE